MALGSPFCTFKNLLVRGLQRWLIVCSYRGLGFDSPRPHPDSQPSVTLVPIYSMPSLSSLRARHVCGTEKHICRQNTHAHKNKIKLFLNLLVTKTLN